MTTTPRTQAEFRRLVHECIERAESIYDIDLGRVTVTFDLRGENAAMAMQVPHPNVQYVYKLRFNKEAIALDWNQMVNSTIPHEVAHLVAFADPKLMAENHNSRWRRIAITLGDTLRGETFHRMALRPARRTRKFLYENQNGATVQLTPNMHRQLQAGECDLVEYARHHFYAKDFREMRIGR
jgi:predicted SprT family Zn-dependent metalloprotease